MNKQLKKIPELEDDRVRECSRRDPVPAKNPPRKDPPRKGIREKDPPAPAPAAPRKEPPSQIKEKKVY
jgi:hypothetical protein